MHIEVPMHIDEWLKTLPAGALINIRRIAPVEKYGRRIGGKLGSLISVDAFSPAGFAELWGGGEYELESWFEETSCDGVPHNRSTVYRWLVDGEPRAYSGGKSGQDCIPLVEPTPPPDLSAAKEAFGAARAASGADETAPEPPKSGFSANLRAVYDPKTRQFSLTLETDLLRRILSRLTGG